MWREWRMVKRFPEEILQQLPEPAVPCAVGHCQGAVGGGGHWDTLPTKDVQFLELRGQICLPSASPVCTAAAMFALRMCLEAHDLERYSLLSYISTAFEISTISASGIIGIAKF
jgi:hypothetical protein